MYRLYKRLLKWSFLISNLLYLLTLIGVYKIAPEYLNTLSLFIRTSVSLFLIIYFNPFSKHEFTDFDRSIVFTSGILLLMNTAIMNLLSSPFILIENRNKPN